MATDYVTQPTRVWFKARQDQRHKRFKFPLPPPASCFALSLGDEFQQTAKRLDLAAVCCDRAPVRAAPHIRAAGCQAARTWIIYMMVARRSWASCFARFAQSCGVDQKTEPTTGETRFLGFVALAKRHSPGAHGGGRPTIYKRLT